MGTKYNPLCSKETTAICQSAAVFCEQNVKLARDSCHVAEMQRWLQFMTVGEVTASILDVKGDYNDSRSRHTCNFLNLHNNTKLVQFSLDYHKENDTQYK